MLRGEGRGAAFRRQAFHGEMFLFPIYYLYFSNFPNIWDLSDGPAVKTHCRGSGFQP